VFASSVLNTTESKCGKTKVNIYGIDPLVNTELFPVADSGAVKYILTAGECLPVTL